MRMDQARETVGTMVGGNLLVLEMYCWVWMLERLDLD